MKQPELILFAKQPQPGRAKTRLRTKYTPEQAAEISKAMIRATVELATSNWAGPISLHAAPDAQHPFFDDLATKFPIQFTAQAEGDLGARMQHALAAGVTRSGAAAILGCDVPHCGREILADAYRWLAHGSNVIGPTEDGGYYFIGLNRVPPELFEDVLWGSSDVFRTTRSRANRLGIVFELLPKLRDIDTPEDLQWVAQNYELLRRFVS